MRFSLKWPWHRSRTVGGVTGESTYQFAMTFPCYVVETASGGLVTVCTNDSEAVAVATDIDLAQRLVAHAERIKSQTARPVELAGKRELLAKLREAEAFGFREVAIDPAEYRSGRFKYNSIPIDKAIEALVAWLNTGKP